MSTSGGELRKDGKSLKIVVKWVLWGYWVIGGVEIVYQDRYLYKHCLGLDNIIEL